MAIKMESGKKIPWYVAGLHFDCRQCSNCCSGPGEGFIWVTNPEAKLIAEFLNITPEQFRTKYTIRFGIRYSIVEHPRTKDCVFLKENDGKKYCAIYSVRPNQCRTWPFWSENLKSPDDWNDAANTCPGINRGKFYSCEQIEKSRKQKKWWNDRSDQQIAEEVKNIYNWIDQQISGENGKDTACNACGKCCDFDLFGHRLYVTTPELIYLTQKLPAEKIFPMTSSVCPYNIEKKCSIHPHRFAACRIFLCKADPDFQSLISEEAVERLKNICLKFDIEYCYTDLSTALNKTVTDL